MEKRDILLNKRVCIEKNFVDLDAVADEIISIDGRGYNLSSYDNIEHEEKVDG